MLYFDFNTQLRTRAENNFEKDLLQAHEQLSVWEDNGEHQEVRKIKLVMTKESYFKKVMKPKFKSEIILSENLMRCEMGSNEQTHLSQASHP